MNKLEEMVEQLSVLAMQVRKLDKEHYSVFYSFGGMEHFKIAHTIEEVRRILSDAIDLLISKVIATDVFAGEKIKTKKSEAEN